MGATAPTDAERIRYALGDTDPENPVISDDEIARALADHPDEWRLAAAAIADSLTARAINNPRSLGKRDKSISWGDRAAMWRQKAIDLRAAVAAEADAVAAEAVRTVLLRRPEIADDGAEYNRRRAPW